VGYEGFEFSAQGVSLDPVYHVTAVAGAEGDGASGVDVRKVGFDVFEAFYEVDVRTAAPVVLDPVLEGHAVSGTAGLIRSYHYIALLRKDGGVPAG